MAYRMFFSGRKTTDRLEAFFDARMQANQERLFPGMTDREIMVRMHPTAGSIPPGRPLGHTDKTGRFIPA
jgi:hypothetical protein